MLTEFDRGQAWGILGFTQTYIWTKDPLFLETSISLANYFLSQLESRTHKCPYVPLWDFDAPIHESRVPLRDTSAGMLAANGLLLLAQIHLGEGDGPRFLSAALRIAKETIELSLSEEKASFLPQEALVERTADDLVSAERSFDAILKNATACYNEDSLRRYWDHGLVYADYYFLEFGNKLIRMGLL